MLEHRHCTWYIATSVTKTREPFPSGTGHGKGFHHCLVFESRLLVGGGGRGGGSFGPP
jgi:hypothetical protein